MITESAQLLSTAHRVLDGEMLRQIDGSKIWMLDDWREEELYRVTHVNHPCSIWCRENTPQYRWLTQLAIELCKEYTTRYHKRHACQSLIEDLIDFVPDYISSGEFREPPQCMEDYCKVVGDAVQAYRNSYINEKSYFAVWKYTKTPDWYLQGIKCLA